MEITEINRAKGSLIGLAVGDAVGTTVEFMSRGSFKPMTDMVGGGPFELPKGYWTDDTSMALCLAYSLNYRKSFDPVDQMNRYCNWYEHGYMSSTGECFDIGSTVANALSNYRVTKNPYSGSTNIRSSGNGCIMKIAPIPIFYYQDKVNLIHYAQESSRTTHGSILCLESSAIFSEIIHNALLGKGKAECLSEFDFVPTTPEVQSIVKGEYLESKYLSLTGSGYVIESLESALWCFSHTDNFRDAILQAVNIGNDADTTAAICGQIAGAYYGLDGIPTEWRDACYMRVEIEELAAKLFNQSANT